jgi:formylglycine-generating enzyme required for sulfatase activity
VKQAETAPPAVPAPPAAEAAPARDTLADLERWDAATPASRRAAAEWVARRMPGFDFFRMETFSCGGRTHEVAIFGHRKTGLEFVLVPPGTFDMGLSDDDEAANDDDRRHRVRLTKPFLIARTECTQKAWDRFDVSSSRVWTGPDLPIHGVTWEQCTRWCRDAGLSLPTNAQWEYACRAGVKGRWCFGDSAALLDEYAWEAGGAGWEVHPVAMKKPNAFGLYDVHGNVEEWCSDWCAPHAAGDTTDPTGPDEAHAPELDVAGTRSKAHVLAGGSWYEATPAGFRWMGRVGSTCSMDGFRPAADVPMD